MFLKWREKRKRSAEDAVRQLRIENRALLKENEYLKQVLKMIDWQLRRSQSDDIYTPEYRFHLAKLREAIKEAMITPEQARALLNGGEDREAN